MSIGRSRRTEPPGSSRMGIGRVAVSLAILLLVVSGCGDQTITNREATKAESLAADLGSAFAEIHQGTLVALFGEDGGYLCAAAEGDDLDNVALVGHRFALRKTAVSERDVAFNRAAIDVYCPGQREAFDAYVDGLRIRGLDDG